MSFSKYLAFDFGAESGRAILGVMENGKLKLEELHRFPNRQVSVNGRVYWDILYLFDELKKGLGVAARAGHTDIRSIGVDTWGVDFGLIDRAGHLIGNPVAYRDARTDGMMEKVFKKMSREDIYHITGIQFMQLNTIFQLYSMVDEKNPQLEIADKLLFMPDLFNYLLTGNATAEYTIASTSQLLDAQKREWAEPVFRALDLPLEIMPAVRAPGLKAGSLLEDIALETGMPRIDVYAPAGHDTACAVAAVPAEPGNWAYLSSGTWSLLGIETDKPVINDHSLAFGVTNEGGVNGKIRLLRNIMGMWLLERSRDVWIDKGMNADYDYLISKAEEAEPFRCMINPDDHLFLNPPDMEEAITGYCTRTGQPSPSGTGGVVRCILESLAMKYRFVLENISRLRSAPLERLHIVGGGSKNKILNRFIADATGMTVITGPQEGTAIGNIMLQAIANGDINDLNEARKIVARSFETETFHPGDQTGWNQQYDRAKKLFEGKE